MERFTISLDADLAAAFDALVQERQYRTRSEAFRDLLRGYLQKRDERRGQAAFCVGTVSYVYNHRERELAERLASLLHEHHEVTRSMTRVPLDHQQCIEVVILQGQTRAVRRFAEQLIAERGVRHGQLNLVSADRGRLHRHDATTHEHFKPRH